MFLVAMEKRCNGSVRSARKVVQKDTLGVSLEFRKIKRETNLDDIVWKITFYFIENFYDTNSNNNFNSTLCAPTYYRCNWNIEIIGVIAINDYKIYILTRMKTIH